MAPGTFNDLPPELLDHITTYLPTAGSVANLGAASRSLHSFVEKDAWQTFARTRFPSLCPSVQTQYGRAIVQSLTTLSRAWDHRALLARYIEPNGDVTAYPGGKKLDRWARPRGQTIGFTPQLDVYEDIGQRWQDREEVLAFSAGAEVCVRQNRRRGAEEEENRWTTWKPLSAREGRDDVTTLHLLREGNEAAEKPDGKQPKLITGTANGDLWALSFPAKADSEISVTYFTTQGLSIRSSSVLAKSGGDRSLLAANLGDSRISLYPVDTTQSKIAPISSTDVYPTSNSTPSASKSHRVWTTRFLSPHNLATGLGPAATPIHVYALTPAGLSPDPVRRFGPLSELDAVRTAHPPDTSKLPLTSVYPIIPLPSSMTGASQQEGSVFLSGAFDGIVRLHDMRSDRHVEQAYMDPTDDGAIYSLLVRGQESFLAGSSRHTLLKVFDLRLGAKCYSYRDVPQKTNSTSSKDPQHIAKEPSTLSKDWNLFLRTTSPAGQWSGARAARGGGRGGSRQDWRNQRVGESSIYSLASSAPSSPFIYAGVENAVLEMRLSKALDSYPDPVFFEKWQSQKNGQEDNWHTKQVLDLAMYDQAPSSMKLYKQRSLWETWRTQQSPTGYTMDFPQPEGLDERWRLSG